MINQKFVGKTYPEQTYQIGFEKVREFAIAVKADREKFSEIVPPTFPVLYQNELLAAVLFDPELKLNLAKLVHGEQEFVYYKPVKVGDTVKSQGRIEKIFQKGPHDFVVLNTQSFNQVKEKVSESIWTFVIRGGNDQDFSLQEKLFMKIARFIPESGKLKQNRQQALQQIQQLLGRTYDAAIAKQDLVHFAKSPEGELQMKVLVDKYMPQVYAGASGDFNIIHLDADFGKSVGLGGYILHGMATMALGANMVCQEINPRDLLRYKARFSAPVKPLDTLTYKGSWDADSKTFNFTAYNQNSQEVLSSALVELR